MEIQIFVYHLKEAAGIICMYWYWYSINLRSEFSLPDGSVGKNVIIVGVDISSSVHIDNQKKDILILT